MRCIACSSYPFLLAALVLPVVVVGQSTVRVSVGRAGGQLAAPSTWLAISGDGRYAAFATWAPVVPSDTNGMFDVYLHELATGIVRRVSVTAGVQPNGNSREPALSDDGRYVVFTSDASNLAPGNNNGNASDVFVKDMLTGTLQQISVGASGVGGNGASHTPSISGDGRFVAFTSAATNLVPNPNATGAFLVDRATGQTQCVSITPTGVAGGGAASVSDDGRFVAFETWAPFFGSGMSTVALLDRKLGTVVCAALYSGMVTNAYGPRVSGDGTTVLFQSSLPYDPIDTDSSVDVYAYDVASGAVRLVTRPPFPGASAWCEFGDVSRDGRYVAFWTTDAYVATDTNGVHDVYVIDTTTNAVELVSCGGAGQSGNGQSTLASLSDDGRWCVFCSGADNLVANDTNGVGDVFMRDRAPGATWTVYGTGLPGTGGVEPGITLLGLPAIGTSPQLAVANNTGAPAAVLVLLGEQPAFLPTSVLGTLLVQPAATSLFVAPVPTLLLPIAIPDVFELTGLHVYLQGLVLDPGAPAGVAFTCGLDATIGG